MDVQEDMIMEEPITEFSYLLDELVATNHTHYAEDGTVAASKVLPLLSKISLKIEDMMKSSDAMCKDINHITLDPSLYDEKLLSSQVQLRSTLHLMQE